MPFSVVIHICLGSMTKIFCIFNNALVARVLYIVLETKILCISKCMVCQSWQLKSTLILYLKHQK